MKAILIIDMPESCCGCRFCEEYYDEWHEDYYWKCLAKHKRIIPDYDERAEFCPLKPLLDNMTPSAEWVRKIQYGDENGSST